MPDCVVFNGSPRKSAQLALFFSLLSVELTNGGLVGLLRIPS